MTVRLAGVIDVLDEAYPPGLAQSWDSVGLVCGDPDDVLSSVTIAVDATAAVVDQVPDGGLLLAHHPLLLRGVDTVAASTAKGALVHRLIRSGRSLFTAHTNADSASPGVSDALAHALGLTVEAVLEPSPAVSELDKWVIFVPPENAEAVRAGGVCGRRRSNRRLLGVQLERHRHRPVPAGRRGFTGHRQRRRRGASCRGPSRGRSRLRGHGGQCCRRCARRIHTRSPHLTSSRWRPCPPTSDWAGSGRCHSQSR